MIASTALVITMIVSLRGSVSLDAERSSHQTLSPKVARRLPPAQLTPDQLDLVKKRVKGVICINLVSRKDRRDRLEESIRSVPLLVDLGYEFLPAVRGSAEPFHLMSRQGTLSNDALESIFFLRTVGGHYMTAGSLGCILSHANAWKQAVAHGGNLLVLEDDVILHPSFHLYLAAALASLPDDFGVLYFADLVQSPAVAANTHNFSPTLSKLSGEYWGAYAYLISPIAAQQLLSSLYPIKYQADSFIQSVMRQSGLGVYRTKENIVSTDNSPGRVSDAQQLSATPPFAIPRNLLVVCSSSHDSEGSAAQESGLSRFEHTSGLPTCPSQLELHFMLSGLRRSSKLDVVCQRQGVSPSVCAGIKHDIVDNPWTVHSLQPQDLALRVSSTHGIAFPIIDGSPHIMQHILCMTAVVLHGGICLSDHAVIVQPIEHLLHGAEIVLGQSQSDKLLPFLFAGKPNDGRILRNLAELAKDVQMASRVSTSERDALNDHMLKRAKDRWDDEFRRSPATIRILPPHMVDPSVSFRQDSLRPIDDYETYAFLVGGDSYRSLYAQQLSSLL